MWELASVKLQYVLWHRHGAGVQVQALACLPAICRPTLIIIYILFNCKFCFNFYCRLTVFVFTLRMKIVSLVHSYCPV